MYCDQTSLSVFRLRYNSPQKSGSLIPFQFRDEKSAREFITIRATIANYTSYIIVKNFTDRAPRLVDCGHRRAPLIPKSARIRLNQELPL